MAESVDLFLGEECPVRSRPTHATLDLHRESKWPWIYMFAWPELTKEAT
jgi:hypothetical protein